MASTTVTSIPAKSSLFSLLRVGALGVGIFLGYLKRHGDDTGREARLRSAIAERDDRIRELLKEKIMRENPPSPKAIKSSGDPVQDWIDSLNE
mmetsp:Transcript_12826/g.23065  ORF Transcript_12826/g.23065 Transcript_12826/m.23065 type:complete len:93 (-) Transcript_12826:40-318(-)